MLGLSQAVSYAVKAMACLGSDRCDTVRVCDVADCTGIPAAYLAKLFTRLAGAGLLETTRGRNGGTCLARPAAEITLAEIVVVMEGADALSGCLLGDAECSGTRSCPMHEFWCVARGEIAAQLASTTLADIIEFNAITPAATSCRETSFSAMSTANHCGDRHHGIQ